MTVDYLSLYVAKAPLSFALSRAVECKVLAKTAMESPILDLGCGDGLFARIFFQGRPVAVGVDLSAPEARRAKAGGAYGEVVLATGAGLPFRTGSFRTVLSNSVLEHVKDLPANLGECYRVLEPAGTLIVTVPLSELSDCFFYAVLLRKVGASEMARRYAAWKHRVWRHHNIFGEKGWTMAIEKAGFKVEELLLFNSRSTASVSDVLFWLSPPSLAVKKLFGRMVLRPAFWSRLLTRALRTVYERDGTGEGVAGTICIVATKASGAGS